MTVTPNGNPSNTEFCIFESTANQYVETNGALGSVPIWQTAANWGSKTVSGLTTGTTYQIFGSNFVNTGSGFFKGISVSSGNTTVSHNSIGNIKMSNIGTPTFSGIEILSGAATINLGNVVGSTNILYSVTMAGNATFEGIKSSSTSAVTINGNTISNINYSGNLGSPKATCYSIKRGSVDQNRIFSVGGQYTTMTPYIYGIYNEANLTGNTISNNMIALKGGNASNPRLYGIYDKSVGNAGSIIHNTVCIQGTAYAAATNLTAAFYREGSASLILYNNILYNAKATTTYAKHYAIYSTSSTAITSNYNDLVTVSPNLVYWGGVISMNLSIWKTASRDYNSISVTPLFMTPTDLHLTVFNTGIDNKGTSTYSMLYDYDGGPRSASKPDMGCDEFGSTPTFTTPEVIEDQVVEPALSIYPNPMQTAAIMRVTVGEESEVNIQVYSMMGAMVQDLGNKQLQTGTTNIEFNSSNLPAGIYICRMLVNNKTLVVKRMEIIR